MPFETVTYPLQVGFSLRRGCCGCPNCIPARSVPTELSVDIAGSGRWVFNGTEWVWTTNPQWDGTFVFTPADLLPDLAPPAPPGESNSCHWRKIIPEAITQDWNGSALAEPVDLQVDLSVVRGYFDDWYYDPDDLEPPFDVIVLCAPSPEAQQWRVTQTAVGGWPIPPGGGVTFFSPGGGGYVQPAASCRHLSDLNLDLLVFKPVGVFGEPTPRETITCRLTTN